MAELPNINPREVLAEDFLKAMKVGAYRLANDIRISQTGISQILKGKRRITVDKALRLSAFF
jgi:addiction module HigA family antidote